MIKFRYPVVSMKANPTTDSVAAVVPERLLSDVLCVLHRSGFGSKTRVIRGQSRLTARLANAGLPASTYDVASTTPDSAVVIVEAHHQLPAARNLLLGLGVDHVETYLIREPSSVLLAYSPGFPTRNVSPQSDP